MSERFASQTEEKRPPAWLEALGVRQGQWYIDTKARAERAMKCHDIFPAAVRIHICLGLATMGFSQELAVTMRRGRKVPLTPADVCRATGIRRGHFRRHMAELEVCGLAECRGKTKGHVELYSWAVPRGDDPEPDKQPDCPARGDNSEIVCDDGTPVSDDLISCLKHYRIRAAFVATRGDIEELENLARVTKEAELSLRAKADCLRARCRPIRKKVTESKDTSSSLPAPQPPATPPQPPPVSPPDPPAAATTTPELPLPPPPAEPEPPAEKPAFDFASEMTRVFFEEGKDNPSPQQIKQTAADLPKHPDATPVFIQRLFIEYLEDQIFKVDHPGGLPWVVTSFELRLPFMLRNSAEKKRLAVEIEEKQRKHRQTAARIEDETRRMAEAERRLCEAEEQPPPRAPNRSEHETPKAEDERTKRLYKSRGA